MGLVVYGESSYLCQDALLRPTSTANMSKQARRCVLLWFLCATLHLVMAI